ncbi:hypothetical protein QBC41DRAFT_100688 [Cercophora samala]|uniref:Uncharacterized protein n=1 Tax=Cercophora samala TaxID=330535 RepID=A0AA39ZFA0_9PEZI|nr:hypothetical protein QBC41DRAFT_100688 [Cercophora samala]
MMVKARLLAMITCSSCINIYFVCSFELFFCQTISTVQFYASNHNWLGFPNSTYIACPGPSARLVSAQPDQSSCRDDERIKPVEVLVV